MTTTHTLDTGDTIPPRPAYANAWALLTCAVELTRPGLKKLAAAHPETDFAPGPDRELAKALAAYTTSGEAPVKPSREAILAGILDWLRRDGAFDRGNANALTRRLTDLHTSPGDPAQVPRLSARVRFDTYRRTAHLNAYRLMRAASYGDPDALIDAYNRLVRDMAGIREAAAEADRGICWPLPESPDIPPGVRPAPAPDAA